MYCREEFTATGGIDLGAAHIGGNLEFTGTANGQVDLFGANIGGQLILTGAKLTNNEGPALIAEDLTVKQSMLCRKPFTAQGEIDLLGANIGDQLIFTGARLTSNDGSALTADGLTVGQDMHCRGGFTAEGEVRLPGAHIGGNLVFDDATLTNPNGLALDLQAAQVGALFLRPASPPGQVDLTQAKVGVLYDDPATWPKELSLVGFAYDTLAEPEEVSIQERLRWLRLYPHYSPQPYEQLAAVYRRAGREEDARRVGIARQQRRRQVLSRLGKVWNRLLYVTVGYGYRTWFAGLWLAGFLLAGTILFAVAHANRLLTAAKPARELQHFNPLVYALDVLLPIVNLGQDGGWVPHRWAAVCYWLLTLAGWVLTTAVVAALSGLLERE
jgi:hypothetical protein